MNFPNHVKVFMFVPSKPGYSNAHKIVIKNSPLRNIRLRNSIYNLYSNCSLNNNMSCSETHSKGMVVISHLKPEGSKREII